MEKEQLKVIEIELDKLEVSDFNPNVQDDKVFNALVNNIEELGMVEPLLVAPKGDGVFTIVGGAHRYEACKVLGYETVPCVVKELDEDMVKFQNVRMNVLKGKLDPVKFTKLFNEMADKYGEELTKEMMAFVDEKAFDSVYMDIKKELPKDLQDKLEEAKEEIKTVDDLSRILNEMFSKYGDTLENDFMVFQYGSKTHYWIIMNDQTKKTMDRIAERCVAEGLNINDIIDKLFEKWEDIADEMF